MESRSKKSLTIQRVKKLSFVFRLQVQCIVKKKENMSFFAKKGNEINAWETQGKDTRAANMKDKHGTHLTKKSPYNKYDGMRISRHEENDAPKKNFPYSIARPIKGRQRNK